MSAPPPNPPLPVTTAPLPVTIAQLPLSTTPLVLPTAPMDSTGQTPPPSTAPPVTIYSPAEMTRVLNDLVTAVQGLYLAGHYGQPPPF